MAKQQQASIQDDMTDVMFPYSGVELTHPSLMGRPDSTPLGENVRTFEPLTGRGRGGSRSGIDKFIDEQVSGDNAIQGLGFVVTTDGEMIGWSFDGIDQSFPGVYGGIGFTEFGATFLGPFEFETPKFPPIIDYDASGDASGIGTFPFVGGSGYAPKTPKNEKIVLNIDSDGGTEINVTDTTEINLSMIAGDNSQLSPNTLAGKVMTLYTEPSGETGDGETSTPGSVTMNVLVGSSRVQKIQYHGEVTSTLGNTVAESRTITINYVPAPRTPIIHWSNPASLTEGQALGADQLNATATDPDSPFAAVNGEFTYDPPSGTVLSVGDAQSLHVDFAPSDSTRFNSASAVVTIDVISGGGGGDDGGFNDYDADVTGAGSGDPFVCPISGTITGGGPNDGTSITGFATAAEGSLKPGPDWPFDFPWPCTLTVEDGGDQLEGPWTFFIAPF